MLKREKINNVVSNLITEDSEIEQCVLDDYEKLKAKCDDVISKIKSRKTKKVKRKENSN